MVSNNFEQSDDDFNSRVINLHFGEIVILEANLQNMEEQVAPDNVMLRPIDRGLVSIKSLLLKIGSAYLETFNSRNEFDRPTPVTFTETELWILRRIVPIGATFRGVPLGEDLKRKVYEALIDIRNKNTINEELFFDLIDSNTHTA